MNWLLAHAGEAHESDGESLLHYLGTWYIALIVFVLGTYLIASLIYLLSKKSVAKTLMVLLLCYLITGLTLYEASPVISILSIFFGFAIAALVAFSSLIGTNKK